MEQSQLRPQWPDVVAPCMEALQTRGDLSHLRDDFSIRRGDFLKT